MTTLSLVPPPPKPFPKVKTKRYSSGLHLHRVHDGNYAGNQFNPCLGQPSRFAPLYAFDKKCVPTLYAADSFDAAVFESIFHDIPYNASQKTVRREKIMAVAHSKLKTKRNLTLVPLYEPELRNWNITKTQLINTLPAAYGETVLWAQAIHAADQSAQGMIWTSRHCDPDLAMIFFEGRVNDDDFEVLETTFASKSSSLLDSFRGVGKRAGITITK
ncbi:MAG: RES family NAD+ phosphorylase [Proteobacteria bacterium]|nr:RES family NAD+ phosphorylase [Pseudomonadota bacterium]